MCATRRTAGENVLVENRGCENGGHDGADYNEDCDDNRWRSSKFEEFIQDCVRGMMVVSRPPLGLRVGA